jgi:Undecaprenyl-phosphate glucose phosphotransferase
VSAVTPELSLGSAVARNPYLVAAPDHSIAPGAPHAIPRQAHQAADFRRPAWLSPELAAFVVGVLDWCLILAAAAVAFVIYFGLMDQRVAQPERHILTAFLAATVFAGMFERLGGYQSKRLWRLDWQVTRVVMAWVFTVAVLLLAAFLSKTSEIYSRGWAVAWIIGAPILLLIGRCVAHAGTASRAGRSYLARNVAIIGAGTEGQRLLARLQEEQDKSVLIRGVFDDRKSRLPGSVCGFSVRGTTDDLLHFARQTNLDEVIIALPLDAEQRLKSLCDKMKGLAIDVRLSLEPLAQAFDVRGLGYVGTVPVFEVVDRPLKNWRAAVKWMEDRLFGSLLFVLVSPLLAVIAILIQLDSPGPVFFGQTRFGFNNQPIRVLKFRTMHVNRSDPSGAQRTVRNDPRVTRLGRILRWLSLDELPQLINVVRGDMSLVGPRPHAVAMKAGDRLYCEAVEKYLHRHRVRPGITGWAQVNGLRGEVDTLEKAHARVAHDLYYIEHWSPWLDFTILLKTAGILASRENAY